jgi:hypothetical protein
MATNPALAEAEAPPPSSKRLHGNVVQTLVFFGLVDEKSRGFDSHQLVRIDRSLRDLVKPWRRAPLELKNVIPESGEITDWSMQLLHEACDQNPPCNTVDTLCALAERGSVQALESIWADHKHIFVYGDNLLVSAARGGRIPNIEWALSRGFRLTNSVFSSAVGRGHLEALQWLREKGCPHDEDSSYNTAASRGHVHVLQWICDISFHYSDCIKASVAAARGGHVNVLEWIREQSPYFIIQEAWDEAATAGHFGVMQWMMEMSDMTWSIPDTPNICRIY